ncbi:MAG: hypothetical protein MUO76_12105, partial [Anaerolineaceae bacterium]|nr:hypothetical protein [Anaerolineaceae bacterium]
MNDNSDHPKAIFALRQAQQALREGNRASAYRWAAQAARLAPNLEAPWLLLASVSNPKASIHYLQQALQINPSSERARQGMHWAIRRYRDARESKRGDGEVHLDDTARV